LFGGITQLELADGFLPQDLPPITPPVRGMGFSIELTCYFEPNRTGVIMIEGARDVANIARIEKICDYYTNTLS